MLRDLPARAFAHRYLPDGRVEFICMSCLTVICRVRLEEEARTHKQSHICEDKWRGDSSPEER